MGGVRRGVLVVVGRVEGTGGLSRLDIVGLDSALESSVKFASFSLTRLAIQVRSRFSVSVFRSKLMGAINRVVRGLHWCKAIFDESAWVVCL